MSLFETSLYVDHSHIARDPFSLFGPETIVDAINGSFDMDDYETVLAITESYPQSYMDQIDDDYYTNTPECSADEESMK